MRQRRIAVLSFLFVAVTWLSMPLIVGSTVNDGYPPPWWTTTFLYIWMFLAPAGALLAIAGLVFDERKWTAGLALALNLLTCVMILGIGA